MAVWKQLVPLPHTAYTGSCKDDPIRRSEGLTHACDLHVLRHHHLALLAWIEIHQDELLADWQLAVAGQSPFKIEPLR